MLSPITRTLQQYYPTMNDNNTDATTMRNHTVRFSDVEAQAIDFPGDDETSSSTPPTAECWLSQNEVAALQRNARDFSCELREGGIDNDSDKSLIMAHQKTTLMLKNDLAKLVQLPRTTPVHDLAAGWCGKDDGRRGLERYASKKFATSRRWDLINYKMAVLLEQNRQRMAAAAKEGGKKEMLLDDKLIASIARKSSRRSRTFALFTGEADALAVRAQLVAEKSSPTTLSSSVTKHHQQQQQQALRPWRVPRSKALIRHRASKRPSMAMSTQLKRDL